MTLECAACLGSGFVLDGTSCTRCGGVGSVGEAARPIELAPLSTVELRVIADELRRIGYDVTEPRWLVEDDHGEGFTMLGRGLDE